MSELRVVAEQAVGAPADLVYRCIADFDRHNPHRRRCEEPPTTAKAA